VVPTTRVMFGGFASSSFPNLDIRFLVTFLKLFFWLSSWMITTWSVWETLILMLILITHQKHYDILFHNATLVHYTCFRGSYFERLLTSVEYTFFTKAGKLLVHDQAHWFVLEYQLFFYIFYIRISSFN